MNEVHSYLCIKEIQVQGANAVSSPLTYGFPAITSFLGAVHALGRKIPFDEGDIHLDGALIASHETRVKRYRPNNYSDYTLNQTRNPIKKTGKTAAIVEEGKLDMRVSLVIPVRCDDDGADWLEDNPKLFTDWAHQAFYGQRLSGGSVFAVGSVELISSESLDDLKARLAPAFILMDARQELADITEELQRNNPEATPLDALMEVAVLHHVPQVAQNDADNEKSENKASPNWRTTSVKHGRGWLVPMPVGYQAISPLFEPGVMKQCRTPQYPSQFVESLYSLGKWVFPYSLSSLESAFWHMSDGNDGFYLVEQATN
ncbi:type I-F CRISPR-associated protein Csy2 [Sansalvadorimonas verongulae]|uniref:type I-F CRISPR-associated protein Csy2 n=1 Tax=Sansalvadorimonas verongulae TaxID=2172824 RepID=UPI0012BB5327|nr:type I-F CRISPR-associated protein Csy2 [Sansalvadorimonas verongulae]MTI12678.1 type I-F CRISPR-associated protein Csy2 [Sansalvadorimonas verongulae]